MSTISDVDLNLILYRDFLQNNELDNIFAELLQYPFQSLEFKYGSRKVTPRRKISAFSTDGRFNYPFSGLCVQSMPFTPLLMELKEKVEARLKTSFNHILLNFYENGEAYISAHKDNEKCLESDASIATLSLGASRTLVFTRPGHVDRKINLHHGSLLVMEAPTNAFWKHAIPKESTMQPRIGITFRQLKEEISTCEIAKTPMDADCESTLNNEELPEFLKEISPRLEEYFEIKSKKRRMDSVDADINSKDVDNFFICNAEVGTLLANEHILKKALSDKLFITCELYNGELKVHIRKFYLDKQGVYRPSRDGITMDLPTWYEFYLKINHFSLIYSNSSFICNNELAILSFNGSMVIRSLRPYQNSIILNECEFDALFNMIQDLMQTIKEYFLTRFLTLNMEKFCNFKSYTQNDVDNNDEIFNVLINCMESAVIPICDKHIFCEACHVKHSSQHKHICLTQKPSEKFFQCGPNILILLNLKEICNELNKQFSNINVSFLNYVTSEKILNSVFAM